MSLLLSNTDCRVVSHLLKTSVSNQTNDHMEFQEALHIGFKNHEVVLVIIIIQEYILYASLVNIIFHS